MKIEWLDNQKEVPGVGLVVKGQEYTVADDVAKRLIEQKQAKEVKKKKTSTINKEAK